ncbi:MAG: MgtC/SapB family protein [Eubacteriales bacterium]|nr:MgtC/SapB family protein [Eubacteriales bacterium]
MSEFLASLREFNTASVILRMVLAVMCGGFIGVEREHKRRPAGFRTHTLVCLGAAMTTLTSQYLLTSGWNTDPARLGAQVVAGIGFIGAGTIIVTRRRQVKGLTTAAGLWVSAIIGLAVGAGYYEGAVIATVFVLIAEVLLSKIEWYISSKAKSVNVYVEYTETESIAEIAEEIKKLGVGIMDIEITRARAAEGPMMSAIFALQLGNKVKRNQLLLKIQEIKGVLSIEEL